MSGQAALASAIKRRVNIPSQQAINVRGRNSVRTTNSANTINSARSTNSTSTINSARSNTSTSINNAPGTTNKVDELNNKVNQKINYPNFPSIVASHQMILNNLKEEISNLRLENSNIHKDINTEIQKFRLETKCNSNPNQEIESLVSKVENIESNIESNINNNEILNQSESKIKTLENDYSMLKKDIENFKIIFLNINKIINDIKSITDANTNELNTMKSFLNEHTFVEKSLTEEDVKEDVKEDEKEDVKEDVKEETVISDLNENKIEMEIKEKE
tara:strand:+ start:38 stop:865 length:828 start_codon:yes stop_codon:yes gene_type:complete